MKSKDSNALNFFKDQEIIIKNKMLDTVIQNHYFIQISSKSDLSDHLYQNINESNFILINQYEEQNQKYTYIIIGFKRTIIVIEKSLLSILEPLFSTKTNLNICLLTEINDLNMNSNWNIIENNQFPEEETMKLSKKLILQNACSKEFKKLWECIKPCISGYLIRESYEKTKRNRIENFVMKKNSKVKTIKEDDIIELKRIASGSSAYTMLAYHIEKEELLVIKKQFNLSDEMKYLISREVNNYSKIHHPFIPRFIGTIESNYSIVMEYINGNTLEYIDKRQLSYNDKILIIFELMIVIEFLHRNHFIYRDLKPNNVMIDENKTAVLIDFDRMIQFKDRKYTYTNDFSSLFIAPEVNLENYSYECDIYSLGLIMFYIIESKNPTKENLNNYFELNEENYLKKIIKSCINTNPKERPIIIELLLEFYVENHEYIHLEKLLEIYRTKFKKYQKLQFLDVFQKNKIDSQYKLGTIYVYTNINKALYYLALAANQNNCESQFTLGFIYSQNTIVSRDINKSIKYFTLAANQKHCLAQFYLGMNYAKEDNSTTDHEKAIYYLTLSAEQNYSEAQFVLGKNYSQGTITALDANKAIHYFTLAANQNHSEAQFSLGLIYIQEKLVPIDIEKSIYYLSLAANQNHSKAQECLGSIYTMGKYLPRDMEKGIHFFTLAANQNSVEAQFNLGYIYLQGEYVPRDIKKGIHYYSLAANQNHSSAQFNLALFYLQEDQRDINKAIHYFLLAANQNNSAALFHLGVIYERNEFVPRDIDRALHYYSLAANLNNIDAQLALGSIYEEGQLVKRNIDKSIQYYLLAVNQNNSYALYKLGLIYERGEYIEHDINKAIHYYSLAADLNNIDAQLALGSIYERGEYVALDIDKAIQYYLLAANQNNSHAQFKLGFIYYNSRYAHVDINKAIHYFSLASNQDDSNADYNLGSIYYEGKVVKRDIQKAISYFTSAATRKMSEAQFLLGHIYLAGIYVPFDHKKVIHYFTCSANQNNKRAQFHLSILYLFGILIKQDINKGVFYMISSAKNKFIIAQFISGYFYQVGLYIKKDIKEAIHYYKEASCFNLNFAKNNLGIIYKNGYEDIINKNIGLAIEYFKEAIRQKNDHVAMYNLAHLYIYEEPIKKSIEKSIKLLIKSSNKDYYPSKMLLCLVSIIQFGCDINDILEELKNYESMSTKLLNEIIQLIQQKNLEDITVFEKYFDLFRNIEYLYNIPFGRMP